MPLNYMNAIHNSYNPADNILSEIILLAQRMCVRVRTNTHVTTGILK